MTEVTKHPYFEDESISLIVEYVGSPEHKTENQPELLVPSEEVVNIPTDTDFGVHFMLQNEKSSLQTTQKSYEETPQQERIKIASAECSNQADNTLLEETLSGDEENGETPLSGGGISPSCLAADGETGPHADHVGSCDRFFCVTCDKSLRSSKSLQRHELTHRAIKRHQCDVCGRKFHQLYNLRTHQVVHTGEKPYKCEKCGKTFSWKISLKGHYQRYHRNVSDGASNYQKPLGKGSGSPHSLPKHEHKCTVCGKTFTRSKALQYHLLTHSTTVQCPVCEKSLIDVELTRHLLTHYSHSRRYWPNSSKSVSREDAFECAVCSKTFSKRDQWSFHLRSHNLGNLDVSLRITKTASSNSRIC